MLTAYTIAMVWNVFEETENAAVWFRMAADILGDFVQDDRIKDNFVTFDRAMRRSVSTNIERWRDPLIKYDDSLPYY